MQEPFLEALPDGEDLLEAMTKAFKARGIRKAAFTVIGAVHKAVIAWYDLEAKQYRQWEFPEALEIVSCMGNVSERDGDTFVHCHIVLGKEDFSCVGGHLMPGTVISVAELFGQPVPGPVPVRIMNEAKGLALWQDG